MPDDSSPGVLQSLKAFIRRLRHDDPAERFEEEIQDLLEHGEEQGRITPGEGEMIQSIFELGETVAREIMIPRTAVVAVSAQAPMGQVLETVRTSGHTRLPVYQNDIDHIEGLLLAKDLLAYWGLGAGEPVPREILRTPIFVPETKKIVELLAELRAQNTHMAIVLDEYGGTAGVVTLEDIIEEIVGDIRDEYDAEEEPIKRLGPDVIVVDARLNIWDLADHMGREFPEGEYETVGGFVTDLIGRVPREGEEVVFQDLRLIIRSADERKINSIEIKTNHPTESGSS